MYEQISKDLNQQFNIKVTGQQCLNRFKNVNKHNINALSNNKVSGNTPTEVPYGSEFEEIKSIDDSVQPEVLVGVNQIKMNKTTKVGSSSKNFDRLDDIEYEKPQKRLKSNSIEQVLREISATAEENRDRRHKEKCDLLISLLGKSKRDSNSEEDY
ncbi:unnamed protein product [Lasius platythorax]|uniref:Uncharacterized protein n=1 Tax=Lasius platythorax TaxID=488582 RepID=A0AAV2MWB6_9HYME